jgi:hypothetical protein
MDAALNGSRKLIHHRFDDGFTGRGLHPGVVHGEGLLFREFAITISVAILVSGPFRSPDADVGEQTLKLRRSAKAPCMKAAASHRAGGIY